MRTLRNAFEADRIAHAFVLTGVRGVGKTTTARIIAKGLNCTGPDGQGGATIEPCGVCDACRVDRRGPARRRAGDGRGRRTPASSDIREIIDSVAYRAASARYKVYIIDEVHMLSTSAFNALLKTLEEPPAHVKFIFATTEIRKVPVTVLSRCQRFDLRRIEPEAMLAHLAADRRARAGDGGAGRAGADRARRRGVGARRAVAARPGDRARQRRGDRGGGAGDARPRRPRPGARPLRGGDGRRRAGPRSTSSPRSTAPAPIRRRCCATSPRWRTGCRW